MLLNHLRNNVVGYVGVFLAPLLGVPTPRRSHPTA